MPAHFMPPDSIDEWFRPAIHSNHVLGVLSVLFGVLAIISCVAAGTSSFLTPSHYIFRMMVCMPLQILGFQEHAVYATGISLLGEITDEKYVPDGFLSDKSTHRFFRALWASCTVSGPGWCPVYRFLLGVVDEPTRHSLLPGHVKHQVPFPTHLHQPDWLLAVELC